jgi:anti-sigma factor RsiW
VPLLHDQLECRDAVELVTDYLEGALIGRQRRSFERHLKGCPNCTAYLAQIRATVAATGKIAPEELSVEARDELIELFRRFNSDRDG